MKKIKIILFMLLFIAGCKSADYKHNNNSSVKTLIGEVLEVKSKAILVQEQASREVYTICFREAIGIDVKPSFVRAHDMVEVVYYTDVYFQNVAILCQVIR